MIFKTFSFYFKTKSAQSVWACKIGNTNLMEIFDYDFQSNFELKKSFELLKFEVKTSFNF